MQRGAASSVLYVQPSSCKILESAHDTSGARKTAEVERQYVLAILRASFEFLQRLLRLISGILSQTHSQCLLV